ncbi:hypothetical protein [Bryobacter aggregatus]|uniref:hypothetical protein n=1 Tax=Bryobacter aggregatus TaxID=360054 RepID=UPI0004E165EC|nr:hypothetical protein [Bryobacter aggregatus]
MEQIKGFDFQALACDGDGNLKGNGIEILAQHIKSTGTTDVILICHGFRNDENDARTLYSNFLENFKKNSDLAGVSGQLLARKFAVGGVFWPSMVFPESNDSGGKALSASGMAKETARLEALKPMLDAAGKRRITQMTKLLEAARKDEAAQLKLVQHLLELLQQIGVQDSNEFVTAFEKAEAQTIRDSLVAGETIAVSKPKAGSSGTGIPSLAAATTQNGAAASFFGNAFGFVPKFLNLTTFLFMFNRCGKVGENGMAAAVRKCKEAKPAVKIHLVGHSLGGRAVTACAKSLCTAPMVKIDSLMLLQAAYSHFGLAKQGTSDSGVKHPRGFFRDVIEKKVVKGPILATHSEFDSVVGFAYTTMAAASLNNAKKFGDQTSAFGGIGRNGILGPIELTALGLKQPGEAYAFEAGKVYNLDGSAKINGKALVSEHGDVTNPVVTWAFASLVAGT